MREIRLWHDALAGLQEGAEVQLREGEAHHFSNVLRGKRGFEVVLMDGLGWQAQGVCVAKEKRNVRFEIKSLYHQEARPDLALCGPIPKGRRFPYMLEKCQELGLPQWGALATEHSVREEFGESGRVKMEERLREACKQSRNPWLMKLEEPCALDEVLRTQDRQIVVLDVDADPIWGVRERLLEDRARSPLLLYGPEAGWSDAERERFGELGLIRLGLSGHHLRMETAAVVGAAMVLEVLDDRSRLG